MLLESKSIQRIVCIKDDNDLNKTVVIEIAYLSYRIGKVVI